MMDSVWFLTTFSGSKLRCFVAFDLGAQCFSDTVIRKFTCLVNLKLNNYNPVLPSEVE